jgi:EmrB/QacA subfamily drug resistance transporter
MTEPWAQPVLRAATAPCSKRAAPWVLAATILGSSMAFIDGTVVNVALPAIQADLGASLVDVQWVVESYSLLLAALLLVGGSLGDHYGRRRIFVCGVLLFAAASACCGAAPGIRQLIVARALQGLGAALLVPGSLALISSSFREEDRGRAIGTWSGFSAMTASIGPVMGGWLVEHFSWRAVFFINLPLALIVTAISLWQVPESASPEKERLDWWGALLIATGLGALVYGLIESSRRGFGNSAVVGALVGGMILLGFFLWLEAHVRAPMLPLHLFRSRTFTGANLLTLFLYGALSGTLFFLPLNLIQVQRYTPTQAGAALLPLILIIFLLSRWSGGLVHRYGARLPLVVGPIIAAIGFALFNLPGVGGSYWSTYFPAVVVLGIGMAISVAPLTTTVMNAVAESRAGIASGVNNAVSRAAGLLAIAVFGIVMVQSFAPALEQRLAGMALPAAARQAVEGERAKLGGATIPGELPEQTRQSLRAAIEESFMIAFRRVMLIGSALALASAGTAFLLIRPNEQKSQ